MLLIETLDERNKRISVTVVLAKNKEFRKLPAEPGVLEWLETEDGQKWLNRNFGHPYGSGRMSEPNSVPGFYSLRDDWTPYPYVDEYTEDEYGGVLWTCMPWNMYGGPMEVL